jgi:muramoyltetrapeptide carboxypeptidase
MSDRPLRRGARVGVVAPGFAVRPEALDRGLVALRRMGFVPVEGAGARSVAGYLAGTDAVRARDLQAVLDDPTIEGIWFARGGYGTARLLDRIDLSAARRHPKPMFGASDLTALFSAVLARSRAICFHAPFVTQLGRAPSFHRASLLAALAGRPVSVPLRAADVIVPGRAEGRLVGGNLTVLVHLLGTPYMPRLDGSILFLEEVGEEAYRLDRLLQHLKASGALDGVRAVALGHLLVPATRRPFPPDRDPVAVVRDHLAPLDVPVAAGIPVGHGKGTWTLPLGGYAVLDTAGRRLVATPRPVAPPRRRS